MCPVGRLAWSFGGLPRAEGVRVMSGFTTYECQHGKRREDGMDECYSMQLWRWGVRGVQAVGGVPTCGLPPKRRLYGSTLLSRYSLDTAESGVCYGSSEPSFGVRRGDMPQALRGADGHHAGGVSAWQSAGVRCLRDVSRRVSGHVAACWLIAGRRQGVGQCTRVRAYSAQVVIRHVERVAGTVGLHCRWCPLARGVRAFRQSLHLGAYTCGIKCLYCSLCPVCEGG